LPAGTYNLLVQPSAPGFGFTSPSTGLQSVVLANNGVLSHIDFGLKREASPWQNQILNEDVDNHGTVDPLDVLILINEINRNGSRPLDGSGLNSPPYYDVNGDRTLGPLDVLQVINYINRNSGGGGEGETSASMAAPTPQSAAPFPSFVSDLRSLQRATSIVFDSTSIGRRASVGPERCGCPACTSFAPSGESSPAVLDIASVSQTKKPVHAKAAKLDEALIDHVLSNAIE